MMTFENKKTQNVATQNTVSAPTQLKKNPFLSGNENIDNPFIGGVTQMKKGKGIIEEEVGSSGSDSSY